MAIIGTCPACGAIASLEAYLTDAEARRALGILCERLAGHGELLRRIPGYLSLHSPGARKTPWGKVARLLQEVADLTSTGTVTRNGVTRRCPPELWALALDEAQDARAAGTLVVPLEGHGWLSEVAWRLAAKSEAQLQAKRLAAARGETPVGYSPAHAGAPTAPPVAHDIRELMGELAALRRLSQADPETHAAAIAALEARLAALRGTPTPQTSTPEHSND